MEVSELVRSLLTRRGITVESDIAAFLNPDYDLHTHDPFLMDGMDRAVDRLLKAIEREERVLVYADFDCDGIPGAAVLTDLFKKIGYANFEVYLPHRDREGYGFHTEAIAEFTSRGVKLVITVDVGTNAVAAVGYAKQLGIDVIVTDHHEISGALPDAVAILNPKIAPYPFPHLCGAAVAFKLACAAIAEGKRRALPAFAPISDGWEKWMLDLVAIATVADMVPLHGENRVLARWGLEVLRKSRRAGITALIRTVRIRKEALTEDDIGFAIAPRINAASRMDTPELAYRLLVTDSSQEADEIAAQLEKLNASRKGVVAGVVKEAKKAVRTRFAEGDRVVFLGNPEWKPALLGLAANSIMQERGGVVCLWGRDAQGRIKGSCRSDGDVSIVDLFTNAGDIFLEAGGHEKSGGFTVSHERIHTMAEDLGEISARLSKNMAADSAVSDDGPLSLPEITSQFFAEVSKLAPFGIGNPKPVFRMRSIVIGDVRRFGKEMNHIEVHIHCPHSERMIRSYDFFKSADNFSYVPVRGNTADLLATIERDTYRGNLALRLVDIVSAT